MVADFETVYPTGGPAERVTGTHGQRVMDQLGVRAPGRDVAFLYSGDGPVTGARGRYMYLVLDEGECVLAHGWIDGTTFDRALIAE